MSRDVFGIHTGDEDGDIAVELRLARFREALRRMRADPGEAARIDAIIDAADRATEPARSGGPTSVRPPLPDTLPRDTTAFVGREKELRVLVTAALKPGAGPRVVTIDGMAGVGKTALAIHAGHILRDHFRDVQLFIDLHAYTSGQSPVEPVDALFALLSAEGVRPGDMPADLDGRTALWRKRMAGRRALVILDNAVSLRQVERLLPGAPGSLVLITSRARLTKVGLRDSAITLSLAPLPHDDAVALFNVYSGRVVDESEAAAVNKLVNLCGYLPLAILLVATRLRPELAWRVADLVDELVAARDRLARIRAEDVTVKAAFDLSYDILPAPQQHFFRRLGLHPGAEFDVHAAAALGGTDLVESRRHLQTLQNVHLVEQPRRDRYQMNNLIRVYARTRAEQDPPADTAAAVRRLMDHYGRRRQRHEESLDHAERSAQPHV